MLAVLDQRGRRVLVGCAELGDERLGPSLGRELRGLKQLGDLGRTLGGEFLGLEDVDAGRELGAGGGERCESV